MKRAEREADEAGGLHEGGHHRSYLGRGPLGPCHGFLSLAWERPYTAFGDHQYVLDFKGEAKLKQRCMQQCYHTHVLHKVLLNIG